MIALNTTSEMALVRAVQADPEYAKAATLKLLQKFTPLINSLSRQFAEGHQDCEDLLQEGRLGLLEALRRYDPSLGNALSTYVFVYIRGRMLRWIRKEQKQIRKRKSDVDMSISICEGVNPVDRASISEISVHLRNVLRDLSPRHAEVIFLRFWKEHKPSIIAEELNVSRARITKLISGGLTQMRSRMDVLL